MSLNYKT